MTESTLPNFNQNQIDNNEKAVNISCRAKHSTTNGTPSDTGVFSYPNNFGGAENTKPETEIISRDLLHVFSPRSLDGLKVTPKQETTKMTESTLQSLYRYYSEIKSTWYKGEYTVD